MREVFLKKKKTLRYFSWLFFLIITIIEEFPFCELVFKILVKLSHSKMVGEVVSEFLDISKARIFTCFIIFLITNTR